MRLYLLFCAFSLFLLATTAAREKPDDWLEVRSAHFVVVSNAGEKQTRNVAGQFERMRAVFQKAFPKIDAGSPITVIAVKNEKDFRALEPEAYLAKGQVRLTGLFLRAADNNFILLRLDAGGDHPYATVYHEYTHFITRKAAEWMPLWLGEGLAEFYENTEIRDKDALLGQASSQNILLLRQSRILPLPTLFKVDHSSPYYHEESKGSIFYAESWALTHYLMMMDFRDNTFRLEDYMQLVSQKTDAVEAASRVFGDLNALQKELDNYLRESTFGVLKLAQPVIPTEAEFNIRTLTSIQAAALRAQFLAYNERAADARALLEAVLREDPKNVSAHEAMGYLEFRQGHNDAARNWYEKAVKLDSHSYLAHYYFAAITMSAAQVDAEDEVGVESSLRTAIKLNPSFAPAYDRLAVFLGIRHQNLDEAHLLSVQAIQLDPVNVTYRLNAANVLMANRRGKDAIAVIQTALKVAQSPEEIARVQNTLQMAEQYQAAQDAVEEQSRDGSQAGSGPQLQPVAEGTAARDKDEEPSPPALTRRAEFPPRGPRRSVTGTIREVQCSPPARMELKLEGDKVAIVLQAENYYKIHFSASGFTPAGTLNPCTELEGTHARVEFVESSGSNPGQITAVELRK